MEKAKRYFEEYKYWILAITVGATLLLVFEGYSAVILPLWVLIGMYWISKNKKPNLMKCPRCNSTNLNVVKPSSNSKALPGSMFLLFGPLGLAGAKIPKNLNVCRECGFSWEDR